MIILLASRHFACKDKDFQVADSLPLARKTIAQYLEYDFIVY